MTKISVTAIRKTARLRFLLTTTAVLASGSLISANSALAVDDHADWDGVSIVEGQGTVTDTGVGTTTIDQISNRAIGEAQELHIGKMGEVTINQNSKDSLFVGRVIGDHSDPTQILGKLSADGRVMIIDRNGVFFGQDSTVDASGIAVTTGDVANTDIMDGNENYTFQNFGNGEIVLEGTVNVNDAGLAAFVAPTVKNRGVINAKMGNVVIAGGEKATLDLYGDGLVEVAVDGALGNTLLENKGSINAEGGSVVMTAQSAKDVVDNVINNEGLINVSAVTQQGGKIILSGGDKGKVSNTGKLDASGTTGGSVKVTGQAVELGSASEIKANASGGEAGKIETLGAEKLAVNGKLQAQGEGKSGFIETSAPDVSVDAGTEIRAGKWLLDPTSIVVDNALAGVIEGQLSVGDAEITTPAAGVQLGRIDFNSTVDWATANTFTANAIDDIFFNGGGGLNATGGGNIVLNAGDDIRMFNTSTGINTNGGDVTLNAFQEVALRGGAGINANGGDIIINNQTGGFYGFANSLNTTGTGTITLNQFKDNIENPPGTVSTIQNAIDALNNTGTGLNTINVKSGTYNENVVIDHDHLALIGKPGDPLVPGAAADAPLVQGTSPTDGIGFNVVGDLSDVTVSGFRIDNFKTGVRADIGGGTVHPGTGLKVNNNTMTNVDQGVFSDEVADVLISYNDIDAKNLGVHLEDSGSSFSSIDNNIFRNTRGPLTGTAVSIRDTFSDDEMAVYVERNNISGFDTGIALEEVTELTPDLIRIYQNNITGNDTGILAVIGSDAGTAKAFNNNISGNFFKNIDNSGSGVFDASGNWFGTTDEASVIASNLGLVDVSPYLASGTDADLGLNGFQGDFNTLYVTDEGAQTHGIIDEAIGLVNPHGQIFVNDGLYTENILVDKSLKLTGLGTAVLNPEFAGEALMTITASDVNIDPLVFDGLGIVKHGIVSNNTGNHGLIVEGNTFRNFKKSAILLKATQGGNMLIRGNTMEGSMNQGIQTGTLQKGTYMTIDNNNFGSEADPLNYIGVDIGRLRNSSVYISGNSVYAKDRGISVTNTKGSTVEIDHNLVRSTLHAVNFHGIEGGSEVAVHDNDLVSSHGTGVKFNTGPVNPSNNISASTVSIYDNTRIEGNGNDGYGIDVYPGELSGDAVINITNNETIKGTFDGIYVGDNTMGGVSVNIADNGTITDTPDGLVGSNGITGLLGSGVKLNNIASSIVTGNYIHDVGEDGVSVSSFNDTEVSHNLIENTGDDGIEVLNGGTVDIHENTLRNIGGTPVLPIAPAAKAEILGGDEWGADGIHVRNIGLPVLMDSAPESSSGPSEISFYPVLIQGNKVDATTDDGIQVLYSGDAYIANNNLSNIGSLFVPSGASPAGAEEITDPYSYGDSWGADGIHVIAQESVIPSTIEAEETAVGTVNKTTIVNNTMNGVLDDGIETVGVNDLLIDSNTVNNVGDDGINILGFGGFSVDPPTSSGGDSEFLVLPGSSYNAVVTNNTVSDAGGDGIQSAGYDTLDVSGNNVSNAFFNGLYISGPNNGSVLMQDNTFTNNGHVESDALVGAGARFESGDIDMSDLTRPNFFVNTTGGKALGMQFDPAESVIFTSAEYGELFAEPLVPVTLANLTIVNETLGATTFDGYTPEDSFYVRFEDGAILNDLGEVIVIDGTDATFDGILPSSTGDILSADDLNFIEQRLWDADDPLLDGRGQIFVGDPAQLSLNNIQDFFNDFRAGEGQGNGLNVTILGLPPVGPLAPQNLSAPNINLADISPQAGGSGEQQTPDQPVEVANIDPAAGGENEAPAAGSSEQVGCWSDLTNVLGTGRSASLSDDGSAETAMEQAVSCGSQQI
jgi:filamentous hemagglutinin family protein